MNQREAVRAFAEFMVQKLFTSGNPVERRSVAQDIADKWSDAQGLEPGRHLTDLASEIKPAPMA